MEKVQVFLDGFAEPQANNANYSHFAYTAIIATAAHSEELATLVKQLSSYELNDSPLLPSNFNQSPDDWARRIDYLARLKAVPFAIVSLVVSQADIHSLALKNSDVFQKYFHRIFVEKIARNFSSFELHLAADLSADFRRELQYYIDTHGRQRDLFNPDRYFHLAPAQPLQPLQAVASFLADTVGRIYCISHQADEFHQAFEQISDRLMVEFFPFHREQFMPNGQQIQSGSKDEAISRVALQDFVDYIEENGHKARHIECLEIAKYLLLIFKTSPHKLVSTKELISVVKKKTRQYSQEQLRQHIAQLRDKGLLIVSPQGRYGYKIPTSVVDVVGFYNRYYGNIRPMLQRVQRSNQKIQLQTAGQVDVLNIMEHFKTLRQLIDVLEKAEFSVAQTTSY
jgi:DNA-binding transcriptional ArsR family regulator